MKIQKNLYKSNKNSINITAPQRHITTTDVQHVKRCNKIWNENCESASLACSFLCKHIKYFTLKMPLKLNVSQKHVAGLVSGADLSDCYNAHKFNVATVADTLSSI